VGSVLALAVKGKPHGMRELIPLAFPGGGSGERL
jgi:hypothetical protein